MLKEVLYGILIDDWDSDKTSCDDEKDLHDNALHSICTCMTTALQNKFLGDCPPPLNLGQHAFKITPIISMSLRIEKTNFS